MPLGCLTAPREGAALSPKPGDLAPGRPNRPSRKGGHMTNRIRGSLLTALAIAAVAAPAASAAPVTINLRVEGATHTIYDGPVTTDEHTVSTASDANTPRLCNGTKVGSPAGPTGTTALDDAAKQNGFTWDAIWDTTSDGDYYPYLTIGPDTVDPADHYW